MKRYAIITNIWGKKTPYNSKNFVWKERESCQYPNFFEQEKYRFETFEELNEFIKFFESYCATLTLPAKIKNALGSGYWNSWGNENERLWGYVWGDKETKQLKWGGYKLKDYNQGSDKRVILDSLFTTKEDIPDDYEWDDGEYEGWLQYRWGDGKNAIGFDLKTSFRKDKETKL